MMRFALTCCSIALSIVAGLVATDILSPARADDCPGANALSSSFIVERGDGGKVSVSHLADGIVRTIYRVGSYTALETTEFQGLFTLERIDRGRRTTFQPKVDLKTLFPLRVGRNITAMFDAEEAGRTFPVTFALVVRKTDTLYIGTCKYAVFQIEKSEGRGGQAPIFVNTDYYAANLKLIIAKEYKERGGASTWVKYDKIYSAQP
jgi:hypothetical protein